MANEYSKELYDARLGAINFTRDTIFWIMKKYNQIEVECGMEKDKPPNKIDFRNIDILKFLDEVSEMYSYFADQVDSMKCWYAIKLKVPGGTTTNKKK